MLTQPPPEFRKRRGGTRRRTSPTAPPTPAALTLVAAEYLATESIRLTFDRAIDIAAISGSAIAVEDAAAVTRYEGLGAATLTGPATVEIGLMDVSEFVGTGTRLTATAGTGIVAAGDAGAWAGATGVELPFP